MRGTKFNWILFMMICGLFLGMASCKRNPSSSTSNNDPAIKPLVTRSDSVREFRKIGISKNENNEFAGSIRYFDKALALDPKDLTSLYYRGNSKFRMGDHDGAIRDFTTALEMDPKNSFYYAGRGLAKDGLKDYAGAIQDLDKAIELSPNDVEFYYFRGNIKLHMNDKKAACSDWGKANDAGYDEAGELMEEYCK